MSTRTVVLVGITFLLSTVVPGGQAQAAGGTPCSFEFDMAVSPGLTMSPSSGTFTSNGETGTLTCSGPVHGREPSGPGTIGVDGRYGDEKPYTCHDDAQGEGTFKLTIPTSDGPEHITDHVTFTHGSYTDGLFTGAFQGDRMSGKFEARPTDGDCVSKPMTRFHIKGNGTLN